MLLIIIWILLGWYLSIPLPIFIILTYLIGDIAINYVIYDSKPILISINLINLIFAIGLFVFYDSKIFILYAGIISWYVYIKMAIQLVREIDGFLISITAATLTHLFGFVVIEIEYLDTIHKLLSKCLTEDIHNFCIPPAEGYSVYIKVLRRQLEAKYSMNFMTYKWTDKVKDILTPNSRNFNICSGCGFEIGFAVLARHIDEDEVIRLLDKLIKLKPLTKKQQIHIFKFLCTSQGHNYITRNKDKDIIYRFAKSVSPDFPWELIN